MTATPQTEIWKQKDILTIVAWLDFCIKANVVFDDAVLARIDERRSQSSYDGSCLTFAQVKQKLFDFARLNAKQRKVRMPSIDHIFARGSDLFYPWLEQSVNLVRCEVDHAVTVYLRDQSHFLHLVPLENTHMVGGMVLVIAPCLQMYVLTSSETDRTHERTYLERKG